MANMDWRKAITQVLSDSEEPMHYTDIAQQIADKKLKTNVGATPATSVNVAISLSLKKDGSESPFVRIGKGLYALRKKVTDISIVEELIDADDQLPKAFINAFGMYWRRDYVHWSTKTKLLGQQQVDSKQVDFSKQKGIYLLHDARQVIYVGRSIDQTIGVRLYQHTLDRLNGRWDRFSWFGIHSVSDTGVLEDNQKADFEISVLIATLEAVLIEGLEPPQNRKRGDEFRASEFIQIEDPQIKNKQTLELIDKLKANMQE